MVLATPRSDIPDIIKKAAINATSISGMTIMARPKSIISIPGTYTIQPILPSLLIVNLPYPSSIISFQPLAEGRGDISFQLVLHVLTLNKTSLLFSGIYCSFTSNTQGELMNQISVVKVKSLFFILVAVVAFSLLYQSTTLAAEVTEVIDVKGK